jgi:hypothetical protein
VNVSEALAFRRSGERDGVIVAKVSGDGATVVKVSACANAASPELIVMAATAVLAAVTAIVVRMPDMWIGLRVM